MKMSVGDWFKIYVKPDTTLYGGAGGTGGTNGNGDFFAYLDSGEDARLEALEAEHRRITQMSPRAVARVMAKDGGWRRKRDG
ncbi:MAG: hypothetical protein LBI87_11985 [Candidatus Accumulibacter sp.]|nr:hypothetical protein [Accumulibacter sp.]